MLYPSGSRVSSCSAALDESGTEPKLYLILLRSSEPGEVLLDAQAVKSIDAQVDMAAGQEP